MRAGPEKTKESFKTYAVERGDIFRAVATSGSVNAVIEVEVGSQISGQIKELYVDFNDEVKKGELVSMILGAGIAYYMASQGDWPILISGQVVAMALASAVMVGVFFGFNPAKTAAELNPIDALRYE